MAIKIPTWIAKLFGGAPTAGANAAPDTHFVYIKLPESIMPLERGEKYEDPIQASLDELKLGEITGGGSQLGNEQPDGTRPIEFCGIDVEVTDLDRGRALLRSRLRDLGAPIGTELQFTVAETERQDELRADGWALDQPRTFLHPGFGSSRRLTSA